jgi:hypothetical protein
LPITDNGVPHWAMQPSIADQTISLSGSSAASSAFNAQTKFVRLVTDTTCFIAFGVSGATPSATASNAMLPANVIEYFGVQGGGKVAAIT